VSSTGKFVTETTFHVRYAETDAMRIVHHSSYVVWFEEARSDYTRQRGEDYANFERQGLYLAVTEVNARYLKPASYGHQVTIRTWIEALQSRGMTFAYEVLHAETRETLVTGHTKHICIDGQGAVKRIPEAWKKWAENG